MQKHEGGSFVPYLDSDSYGMREKLERNLYKAARTEIIHPQYSNLFGREVNLRYKKHDKRTNIITLLFGCLFLWISLNIYLQQHILPEKKCYRFC